MLEVTCSKMDAELSEQLAKLGISGSGSGPSTFSENAEDYTNTRAVEQLWAIKAMKYAETHLKLLTVRDAKELRLTKYDSEMYEQVMKEFKGLKVDVIDVREMKSDASKAKWRIFFTKYDKSIVDYNFGTLLRIDSSKDYSDENTFIVPRIQFLAVEVVRNKSGFNSVFYKDPKTTSVNDD